MKHCFYLIIQVSSVQSLNRVKLFATPWTAACQTSLSITNSEGLFKLMSIKSVMLCNHLILCHPFSSHLQSFPASGSFLMSQFFSSGGQSIGASALPSVLPKSIQGWFPLRWTSLISWARDFQESPLGPQFESISSSVLCLLYGPALTSVHNYHITLQSCQRGMEENQINCHVNKGRED